jgi:hypothetical protein
MLVVVRHLIESPGVVGFLSFLLITAPVIGLISVYKENEKV